MDQLDPKISCIFYDGTVPKYTDDSDEEKNFLHKETRLLMGDFR